MNRRWWMAAGVAVWGAMLAGSAAAATVGVSVGNYYFEDSTVGDGQVVANVGDQLKLTVVEGAGHTVTIDALGIDSGQLVPGAVFVTPALNTPGTYTLYCRTHIARGHATTLVVRGSTTTTTRPARTTSTTPASTTTSTTVVATVPGGDTPVSSGTPDGGGGSSGGGGTSGDGGTSSGSGTSSGGSIAPGGSSVVDGSGDPTGTNVDGELLPVGVIEPGGTGWLRSLWIGLLLLPVIAAAVTVAVQLGERHHRASLHVD